MAIISIKTTALVALIATFAALYRPVSFFIFTSLGIRRDIQTIGEFPYTCRRLQHKLLESCEDLWLDHDQRRLYAACSDVIGRIGWVPAATAYNTSSRRKTDHFSVLDIDQPGEDGFYGLQILTIPDGYSGSEGGKDLDLHGFDVEILSNSKLRFRIVNHRPPIDPLTGELVDAWKVGQNSTIEVFDLGRNSNEFEFVKTIAESAIHTPNDVAIAKDGGFFLTNDHTRKVGFLREFEAIIGTGSLGYCSPTHECKIVDTEKFNAPNGIARGKDGLIYVARTFGAQVTVHRPEADGSLQKLAVIDLGMPVDNLSVDSDGDIYAACFPDLLGLMKAGAEPLKFTAASTVMRIRKSGDDYEVTKIMEDRDGEVLPGNTVAVHDSKTGRFFLGGIAANFITVCERNN